MIIDIIKIIFLKKGKPQTLLHVYLLDTHTQTIFIKLGAGGMGAQPLGISNIGEKSKTYSDYHVFE